MNEEIDDKKKIAIGIANLVGIILFTVIGIIIKNLFFKMLGVSGAYHKKRK